MRLGATAQPWLRRAAVRVVVLSIQSESELRVALRSGASSRFRPGLSLEAGLRDQASHALGQDVLRSDR